MPAKRTMPDTTAIERDIAPDGVNIEIKRFWPKFGEGWAYLGVALLFLRRAWSAMLFLLLCFHQDWASFTWHLKIRRNRTQL